MCYQGPRPIAYTHACSSIHAYRLYCMPTAYCRYDTERQSLLGSEPLNWRHTTIVQYRIPAFALDKKDYNKLEHQSKMDNTPISSRSRSSWTRIEQGRTEGGVIRFSPMHRRSKDEWKRVVVRSMVLSQLVPRLCVRRFFLRVSLPPR